MDCREARRLLDAGVMPGSSPPERATLGFHVARCPACRAYQATPLDERLLAGLLERPPPRFATTGTTVLRRPALSRRPWVRRASMAVVLVVVLAGLLFVGQAALAVATIAQNVRSMRVPTPPLATPPLATIPPLPTDAPAAAAPLDLLRTPAPVAVSQGAAAPGEPVAVGAEPSDVASTAAPLGWPTAPPVPAQTPTVTPVPLGGETVLAATQLPAGAPPLGFVAPQPVTGAVTVLMLGLDRRPDEVGPARMDAVIIARLDPERRRVALLSLPRDLVVDIPGYGSGRINAASVYGELYPQLGGGPGLARATVSQLLGVPIDYVVQVDFGGFVKAVDAIGGVTIDVPTELYDPQYPTMDYGYQVAHFLPGPQHMDGDRALMYARVRHMDSDFARMARQQQVIVAAVSRLRGQNVLQQLNSVASISGALQGYVTFDIPEDKLASLAWAFRDLTPEQVERYALDGSQLAIGAPGDPYAEFALPGAIDQLVRQLMGS